MKRFSISRLGAFLVLAVTLSSIGFAAGSKFPWPPPPPDGEVGTLR
jgi:hypothetical protein